MGTLLLSLEHNTPQPNPIPSVNNQNEGGGGVIYSVVSIEGGGGTFGLFVDLSDLISVDAIFVLWFMAVKDIHIKHW